MSRPQSGGEGRNPANPSGCATLRVGGNHPTRYGALPRGQDGQCHRLAPAGDWDCVKAAVENGADAIYFGLDRFNARMRARNSPRPTFRA